LASCYKALWVIFPNVLKILLCVPQNIEMLPIDILMVITKKVVAFGNQDLLNFGAISKLHHQLGNKKAILRALNRDCLWYIVDPTSFSAKRRFVHKLSNSGHSSYRTAIAAFMLHQIRLDLERIKQILAKAMKQGSDGATYFNLMMEVVAADNPLDDQILPVFQNLFERHQLAHCRNAILHTVGPRFSWDSLCFRPMLLNLRYQFFCPTNELWNGIRRIHNVNSPFPVLDEDYPTKNFCLSCCLNLELAWFLWPFRFLDLGFLW